MNISNYEIVEDSITGEDPLIIKDVGPWNKFTSVTNNAERVVIDLFVSRKLMEGQRLLYYDTEGNLDEIVIKSGHVVGFKPCKEDAA